MKVKTILVSQPEPQTDSSPYSGLIEKRKVKVDFCPFIHVEGVSATQVREQKISMENFTAVIFTSKNAVDHFFRLEKDMRWKILEADKTRFFCQTEAIASHLSKFLDGKKRKIHTGKKFFSDLKTMFKKYSTEKFLLPTSDILQPSIPVLLDELGLKWDRVMMYKTVCSDLSHLKNIFYDVLVFFSPSGIKSLLENFPDFEQNNTRIAAFGKTTVDAVQKAGLKCQIQAPAPDKPSMTVALDHYIQQVNKG